MNILYLLGNGLDMNLGLKTSYRNFYDYYEGTNSENSILIELSGIEEKYGENIYIGIKSEIFKF